jgi:hypothetical protein
MTPFKATLGFEPTSPSTATFEENEPSRTLPEQVKILVEIHKFALDCVKGAQAHMQESANRHRLLVSFAVSDKDKLKAANLRFVQQPCSKLRDRYIGMFLITEEVSPVAFWHKLSPRVRIHDVVHVTLPGKWNSYTKHADSAQRILIVHDAKRFEVDRLLDVAFNSNGIGILFKVR